MWTLTKSQVNDSATRTTQIFLFVDMIWKVTLLVVTLSFLSLEASAQNAAPLKVGLKVSVRAENSQALKQRLTSYIKRELRYLNDVAIVEPSDNQFMFVLRINVVDVATEDGASLGAIALSAVSTAISPNEDGRLVIYFGQNVYVSPLAPSKIQIVISQVVSWFDTSSLEQIRRARSRN